MIQIESPWRDEQDKPPIGKCKRCGHEIYHSDAPIITEDGERIHFDCFEEYVFELLMESPAIVAECLGMKFEEAT